MCTLWAAVGHQCSQPVSAACPCTSTVTAVRGMEGVSLLGVTPAWSQVCMTCSEDEHDLQAVVLGLVSYYMVADLSLQELG